MKYQSLFSGKNKTNITNLSSAELAQISKHYTFNQGPVVQSVVSLTSSIRFISLTVLAASMNNILIFFAEKM